MIAALKSLQNEELQKIGKRVAVVRIENKKNDEYSLTKKTVKTISDDYTALQNSFNRILVGMKNIKTLQDAQSKTPLPQNNFIPVGGSAIGIDQFVSRLSSVGKIFENLAKKFNKLDLTPQEQQDQEDVEGEEEIDIDVKKKKKKGSKRTKARRGKVKGRGGGRLGIFGKALGIASDAIGTSFDVVGKSLGIASDAIGTSFDVIGNSVGIVGKGLKLAGGALGVLGGGYLAYSALKSSPSKPIRSADKDLLSATSKAVTPSPIKEPTPISSNSYSSRFADYLKDTFENVSGYIGKTVGSVLGAAGLYDFGPGAGSTENAQIAMDFFMSPEGGSWTREQAAGIVGNLQGESSPNLNPNAVGDSGNAYGIAQWNQEKSPDRVANFKNVIGTDLRSSNLQQQLKFVNWELQNTEKAAGNKLRSAKDIQSATIAMSYYERYRGYKEELGSAETRSRIGNAQAIYEASKISGGALMNPIPGARLTSDFGPRDVEIGSKNHKGLDFGVGIGTPVKASHDGMVVLAQSVSGYGNAIYIDRGDGMQTRYAHLSRFKVQKGDRVVAGQDIADSGNTGRSSGPHLHFEVRINGNPVNPLPYLTVKEPAAKPLQMKDFPLLPPKRRKGDGSIIMMSGQNPYAYMSGQKPQILFPYASGSGGASPSNPSSREAMKKYHGL